MLYATVCKNVRQRGAGVKLRLASHIGRAFCGARRIVRRNWKVTRGCGSVLAGTAARLAALADLFFHRLVELLTLRGFSGFSALMNATNASSGSRPDTSGRRSRIGRRDRRGRRSGSRPRTADCRHAF